MIGLPAIDATIERRILLNYRIDPDVLAELLPPPLRPLTVGGYGVAGVCLIRLGAVRPAGFPARLGVRSENAAHRIAVEWDGERRGVYILRRDTASLVSAACGGRVFSGWQHRARFEVDESADDGGRFHVAFAARDGSAAVSVAARRSTDVMPGSVFKTVDEASDFFRSTPDGYAATPTSLVLDGVRLETSGWSFEPLAVDEARSSFYDELPVTLDSAFLMTGLESRWRPLPDLRLHGPASRSAPWLRSPAGRRGSRAAAATT